MDLSKLSEVPRELLERYVRRREVLYAADTPFMYAADFSAVQDELRAALQPKPPLRTRAEINDEKLEWYELWHRDGCSEAKLDQQIARLDAEPVAPDEPTQCERMTEAERLRARVRELESLQPSGELERIRAERDDARKALSDVWDAVDDIVARHGDGDYAVRDERRQQTKGAEGGVSRHASTPSAPAEPERCGCEQSVALEREKEALQKHHEIERQERKRALLEVERLRGLAQKAKRELERGWSWTPQAIEILKEALRHD